MQPSGDEWERIKRIFEAAILLPSAERSSYLESACGSNLALLGIVASLIANYKSDNSSSVTERNAADTYVFSPGQLVAGRFRIVKFINRGGMGEVYEAIDERLGNALALKTIRPEMAEDNSVIERFRREIRVAHQVAHSSLCRVFDLVEHNSGGSGATVHCLSMELLSGESLGSYLEEARPLSPKDALPLIRQIATALQVLHDQNIIHRDLKPSNIMLVPGPGAHRAVVTDFGLARPLHDDKDLFKTHTEFAAGAPYFMAPELFTGQRPSIASDIYAFGLVMDEMVTRSRAFTAESPHIVLYQKFNEKPISPAQRADNLPSLWEDVILRCLDANPERRFERVEEITAVLEGRSRLLHARRTLRITRRRVVVAAASAPVLAAGAVLASLALKPVSATMVVFPVVNASGDPGNDYICQITTSEILRRLSTVEGVGAYGAYASRSDSHGKFDARFLLEGRLENVGSQLEIIFSLTDTLDGQTVWTHGFDARRKQSALDLQSEITQHLVEAVERYSVYGGNDAPAGRVAPIVSPLRKMIGSQPTGLPGQPTSSGRAWDLYSRAHHLLENVTQESTRAAIEFLTRATVEDPNFALAYADLARAQFLLWDYHSDSADTLLSQAERCARKALACDPKLPESHLAMAAVQQNLWEWEASTVAYRKALQLRPRFPQALRWFSGMLVQFGRYDEGIDYARQAVTIDPYEWANSISLGAYLYFARRFDQAEQTLKRAVKGNAPIAARQNLGIVYAWRGRKAAGAERDHWFQLAFEQVDEIAALEPPQTDPPTASSPALSVASRLRGQFLCVAGQSERAHPYLVHLEQSMNAGKVGPCYVASLHNLLGDSDVALLLLDRAFVLKDRNLMFVKVNPYFDSLRTNPQFQSVVRGMQLA